MFGFCLACVLSALRCNEHTSLLSFSNYFVFSFVLFSCCFVVTLKNA